MKTKLFTILSIVLLGTQLYSQDITGTLGTNGSFYIKDLSTDFFKLMQSNGYLGLGNSPTQQLDISGNFELSNTTDSTKGIVYKESVRFLHNYCPVANGNNTFLGLNSGNFTMNGPGVKRNTGIGVYALNKLITGSSNTSVGSYSLSNNTGGIGNTAVGTYSLENNLANNNVAIGFYAMQHNTTGEFNSAVGPNALNSNLSGDLNVAHGSSSLIDNTSGQGNTGIGTLSLASVTTGNNNTALGNSTATNLVTGSNNIVIGYNAQTTSSAVSNQIVLGNNLITSLRCNVQSITSLSDMRDKKNIDKLSLGLDFIDKLKPRQFNWDKREWYENNKSDGSKTEDKLNAGFIAQELDEVQSGENADWLGLVNKDNPEKIEATYGNLLPVMVKAIQELSAENKLLKAELGIMNELQRRVASFEKLQSELRTELELIKDKGNENATETRIRIVKN